MANMGPDGESYPSPAPQHRLPFYQGADLPPRQQDGGAMESEEELVGLGGQDQTRQRARQHGVPDDPQLRANLASMMSTVPYTDATQAQQSRQFLFQPASLPESSAAFAHRTISPDTAPSSSIRRTDRSKTSRACDECRRKKIRCDAVDETGNAPCTNCARTAAACAFSRQPMKRGPSKGYIKELAERLNSLESQIHAPNLTPQIRQEMRQVQRAIAEHGVHPYDHPDRFAVDPRVGDKRSRDVTDGLHDGDGQFRSMHPSNSSTHPHSLPNEEATATQFFWRPGAHTQQQEPTGLPYELDSSTLVPSFDWDETVVDEYYRIIHQTFPLLPSNKNRLRQRLTECPTSLREAFLAALDCLMRTFPTTSLPAHSGYAQALKRAAELLAKYPFDNPSSHTPGTNLVYLQTLLLMALESDNHGPATIRGQAGPSRAEWLGRAAGVAGNLEINTIRSGSTSIMEGDRDSEERLARRVWWVLFILDRWHASSTADLLKLPENSVVLLPEDQILLGESTYHLARLSFIIGHLASILTTTKTPSTDVMAPSNPASSLLGLTLAGEIDRFRESVESVWGSLNLVHLSYHHCHLLIKRLAPTTEPVELVGHAVKVATVLNSRLTPVTPLNHHFAALAAMTLCELCDVPKTRAEALRGLEQMIECLGSGVGLAGKQESEGWDGAIRELVVRKRERMMVAQGGLEGLADAAVGEEWDPTMLTRYGYLTALGQGRFMTR